MLTYASADVLFLSLLFLLLLDEEEERDNMIFLFLVKTPQLFCYLINLSLSFSIHRLNSSLTEPFDSCLIYQKKTRFVYERQP